jgi:hypothetical protein
MSVTTIRNLSDRAACLRSLEDARPTLPAALHATADEVIAVGRAWVKVRGTYQLAAAMEDAESDRVEQRDAELMKAVRRHLRTLEDDEGRVPPVVYELLNGTRPSQLARLRPDDKPVRFSDWLNQLVGRELEGDAATRGQVEAAIAALDAACAVRLRATREREAARRDVDAAAQAFDAGYAKVVRVGEAMNGGSVPWAARLKRPARKPADAAEAGESQQSG